MWTGADSSGLGERKAGTRPSQGQERVEREKRAEGRRASLTTAPWMLLSTNVWGLGLRGKYLKGQNHHPACGTASYNSTNSCMWCLRKRRLNKQNNELQLEPRTLLVVRLFTLRTLVPG